METSVLANHTIQLIPSEYPVFWACNIGLGLCLLFHFF